MNQLAGDRVFSIRRPRFLYPATLPLLGSVVLVVGFGAADGHDDWQRDNIGKAHTKKKLQRKAREL
jgi:hypothetical protein